jgi:NADH dehydrogenase (ubiquinone) 1 alpha subcomplex subunit 6
MIREKKRADFERHRGITDVNVIDMLIFKSKQEYQETMNCWKTEVSVQGP